MILYDHALVWCVLATVKSFVLESDNDGAGFVLLFVQAYALVRLISERFTGRAAQPCCCCAPPTFGAGR